MAFWSMSLISIDLCQNPLTVRPCATPANSPAERPQPNERPRKILQKEPKLSRARQIPEWETYDSEIARFARKLADEGKLRSHVATADANVLANANANPNVNENGVVPYLTKSLRTIVHLEIAHARKASKRNALVSVATLSEVSARVIPTKRAGGL